MNQAPPVPPMLDAELARRRAHLVRESRSSVRGTRRPLAVGLTAVGIAAVAAGGFALHGIASEWAYSVRPARPAAVDQSDPAVVACHVMLDGFETDQKGPYPEGTTVPVVPVPGFAAVLVDRRGASEQVLLASTDQPQRMVDCFIYNASDPNMSGSGASGGVPKTAVQPSGDGLSALGGGYGFNINYGSDYELAGRIGPDVASVDIGLSDGTLVPAVTAPTGWWSAYWPNEALTPAFYQVHDTDGSVHDVDPQDPAGPPQPNPAEPSQ